MNAITRKLTAVHEAMCDIRMLRTHTVAERYEKLTIGWNSLYGEDERAVLAVEEPRGRLDNVDRSPRWINLGYWESGTQSLSQAAKNLAAKVGDAAAISPGEKVLDVGCGFGDSTIFWFDSVREKFGKGATPPQFIGLNITALHARHARIRVGGTGHEPFVCFVIGDATRIPCMPESVDKVIALECAFHFDTRETFFKSAYDVLKPGGRVVTADVVLQRSRRNLLKPFDGIMYTKLGTRVRRLVEEISHCPYPNLISAKEYAGNLELAGYCNVQIEDISGHVFQPFVRYWKSRLNRGFEEHFFRSLSLTKLEASAYASAWRTYMRILMSMFGSCKYIIAIAEKPEAGYGSS